jgi:serine/threonine protein kinase
VPGYEILGELGRGGMGVVYKARQVSLNRLVALKMILAGKHAEPEERQRFQREAEVIACLGQPNIVELVEGASLPFEMLTGRPVSISRGAAGGRGFMSG